MMEALQSSAEGFRCFQNIQFNTLCYEHYPELGGWRQSESVCQLTLWMMMSVCTVALGGQIKAVLKGCRV